MASWESQSNSTSQKLPATHFKAGWGWGEGTNFALADDSNVELVHYYNGQRVNLFWPTPLGIREFFDQATSVLGKRYSKIWVPGYSYVPKNNIPAGIEDIEWHSWVPLSGYSWTPSPEDLGELTWENDSQAGNYKGGLLTNRIGDIAVKDLMRQTGTEAVVEVLETIVSQVESELQVAELVFYRM